MNHIKIKAYAKINLGLDVIRKREDGYHEVRMIMQSIGLFDTVSVKLNTHNKIILTTNLTYLPTDENNLVYKAARLIKDQFKITSGIDIYLKKTIPVAAGLAGGSSDCAATLKGLNELFQLGLTTEELMKLGVTLGADVPFCILQGTALSEGIGEILTPLSAIPPCHVLIVKPDMHVSTKFVYEHLNINTLPSHPDIDGIISAISNQNIKEISLRLENVLETVTIKKFPVIEQIKQHMLSAGALGALMSGSGPTVFGLFQDIDSAKKAYNLCKKMDRRNKVFLTKFYNTFR